MLRDLSGLSLGGRGMAFHGRMHHCSLKASRKVLARSHLPSRRDKIECSGPIPGSRGESPWFNDLAETNGRLPCCFLLLASLEHAAPRPRRRARRTLEGGRDVAVVGGLAAGEGDAGVEVAAAVVTSKMSAQDTSGTPTKLVSARIKVSWRTRFAKR